MHLVHFLDSLPCLIAQYKVVDYLKLSDHFFTELYIQNMKIKKKKKMEK